MESWPRVVVVGPGGVGAYFGGMLARAGAPVTMLGRSGGQSAHLVAMARNGLRLETLTFDERVPVETATSADVVAAAELVLFSVKTPDTDEAARRIAPHVSDRAVIVDLQNGVDNPERLRHAGIDPIVAVVYVAAAVETPGSVKHCGRGDLVIGHRSRASEVQRVAAWFARAGVSCQVSEDVERELWFKLILNSMTNAVSALTGASYGGLAAFEPAWQVAVDVAHEGIAVARAAGYDFDPDAMIERGLEVCRAVGAATSSTRYDIARGRPTEIDALNGFIARRGSRLAIETPINRVLWALVKLREQHDQQHRRKRPADAEQGEADGQRRCASHLPATTAQPR